MLSFAKHRLADHDDLHLFGEPAAISLNLAKYLGEGTSQKKAEEKSSALSFLRFLRHLAEAKTLRRSYLLLKNRATKNVIS